MSQDSGSQVPHLESAATAEKDYQTLLQAAPDPILIADPETGTIIETNEAATALLGYSRDELIGTHQAELHPKDAESQYRELFARHAEAGGTKQTLPDGSQMHVLTSDGEQIPVEISANRIELSDQEVVFGVFRDVTDGLATQSEAKAHERRYKSFFENNPMNIWEEDLSALKAHLDALEEEVESLETHFSGNTEAVREALQKIDVIDVNQNAVEYYDANSKAQLKANLSTLFTDEAYDTFVEILLAIAEGRTTVEIETSSYSLSGEKRTERIELYVPEAFEDDYRRGYLITNDITDRKEREQELRSFKQAVENAGHSVVITDEEGAIEYVNPTFEAVTGYTKEEVLGENPRVLKSGEHDGAFYDQLWETILAGEVWSAELINERKDGDQFVVDQTIAPIIDDDGSIQQFVAVNQDITERKERERELFTLQHAVEYAGHSIYITDTDGTIEYVNEAFESLTGYSAAEAMGETHQLFRTEARDPADDDRLETVLQGEEWTGEMVIEAKSGERFVVDETLAPIEDDAGLIRGFVGVQTDITERKLREQQLAVFARVLRHNLRNDGTTIKGRAQLLEESTTDDDQAEHLRKIQENIETLLEIGEKAHHVQRTIADSLTVEERRDLIEFLENMASAMNITFPKAEVTLDLGFAEPPSVDPRVVPAIQELVRNAIEHSNATVPAVEIVAKPENGMAVIEITDNGPGIPAEEKRVIEEGTEEPLKHGSGLGLWLAYWLITFVGGDIYIDTGDAGTTVSLTVPRKRA